MTGKALILKLTFSLILLFFVACQQDSSAQEVWEPEATEVYEPVPPVVSAEPEFLQPPSDAIILFDGSDFSNWKSAGGGEVQWSLDDGVMTVKPGTGNIITKDQFGSVQLYLEWKTPEEIEGDGQGRGNSGVFFQRRYEVQVLDSYENETYVNGMAGSIYKQYIPYANAAMPPGEWQTYYIIFEAPEFDDTGSLSEPGYLTVFWNGVLVHHHSEVKGTTVYIGPPEYEAHDHDGIMLQDHSDMVSFRNIWVRNLDDSPVRN